mgnify:CR=1 FL=1
MKFCYNKRHDTLQVYAPFFFQKYLFLFFQEFHESITDKTHVPDETLLAKTFILLGVKEYPARVKCATLGWHTLIAALKHDESEHSEISTE